MEHAMRLDEFERRFDSFWDQRYSLYNPETDHWTRRRVDDRARQQCRELLTDFARAVQDVGLSRRGKNKAQRLFDELGIDPTELEIDVIGKSARTAEDETNGKKSKSRIMYIERKGGQLTGEARIGRVTYSKSGRSLYYGGRSFRSLDGQGFKANYYCVETDDEYWISGCKRDGSDRLYGERVPIHIDVDAMEEYWTDIRRKPECKTRDLV
jgi:hypothetical protein